MFFRYVFDSFILYRTKTEHNTKKVDKLKTTCKSGGF